MLPPTASDGTTFYSYAPDPGGAGPAAATSHAWKDGSFSFHDVLDTLNPLQHLPLISTLYRWVTGDEPGNVASIVGDTLYGGPIGLAAGLFTAAFKAETGKEPGEMIASAITGEDDGQLLSGTATAQTTGPTTAAATAAPAATATTAVTTAAAAATANATSTTATAAAAQVPVISAAQPLVVSAAAPHPFLPLFRSPPPVAAAAESSSATGSPEQAFLAQSATYRRNLYGQPHSAPVPLQLTGPQQSFTVPPRPPAALPAPTSSSATLPPNVPADIPQRMMEALDKYARMKQQQEQQQRGQQVDVAP
ncbi:MAG TPA: hypothetical protein VMA53_19075 [Stellaceae bacterium]|nr:hypothetical protein [Stellaceae bacterium]